MINEKITFLDLFRQSYCYSIRRHYFYIICNHHDIWRNFIIPNYLCMYIFCFVLHVFGISYKPDYFSSVCLELKKTWAVLICLASFCNSSRQSDTQIPKCEKYVSFVNQKTFFKILHFFNFICYCYNISV